MLKTRNAGFALEPFVSKRKNAMGVVESCFDRMSNAEDPTDRGLAVFDVDENTYDDIRNALELAQKNGI
jgi:hypothetical protein